VDFFSDNAPLYRLVAGGVLGVVFSYYWHLKTVEPMVKSKSKMGVLITSLPFVISWVLITKTAYGLYMDKFVSDNNYTLKKAKIEHLEKSLKDVSALKNKVKKEQISVTVDTSKVDYLIANKEQIVGDLMVAIGEKRKEWKHSRHRYLTDYQSYIDRYVGDIGRGKTAIRNISIMLYQEQLEAEQEKVRLAKRNALKKSGVDEVELTLKEELDKRKELKELKNEIKKIEDKDIIGLSKFYIFMFFFGVFIEVIMTNISFWISFFFSQNVKKEVEFKSVFTDKNAFLQLLEMDKPNYRANAVFAVLQCYANGEKLTQKNIEKYTTYINETTNRPYRVGKVGLEAKRVLVNHNNVLKDDLSKINENQLLKVIKSYVY
jgi:hypothetical protein